MRRDERNHPEPQIFLQSFELTKQIMQSTSQFPKPTRYVLGRKLEERSMEFLLLLNRLVGPTGIRFRGTDTQKAVLVELSHLLDEFRILLRMSREAGMYSAAFYDDLNGKTQSIGRQLGGLMRAHSKDEVRK